MPISIKELQDAMKEDGEIKDFFASSISTAVSAAVDDATKGLKTTNTQLKTEKKNLQATLDKMPTKEQLESYSKMQANLDSSEDAKLISEGKMDEVINRKTERIRLDLEKKFEDSQTELNTTKETLSQVNSNYANHRIDETIRKAAVDSGVSPEAIEDVVLRSVGIFSIDEKGAIIALDSEGHVATNEAGTPLDPKVFVSDLKEKAPHFWPGSSSGGLNGSGGASDDSLIAAAEKGNVSGFIDQRRAQLKKKREAKFGGASAK